MPKLKKVISLHQASLISGYHQDYLSALIRKGELKGEKMGRNWLTTEEEIKKYIFKQKMRNKNWVVKNFLFFFARINKSFLYAGICVVLFSVGIYFYNQATFSNKAQTQAKAERIQSSNIETLPEPHLQELKF